MRRLVIVSIVVCLIASVFGCSHELPTNNDGETDGTEEQILTFYALHSAEFAPYREAIDEFNSNNSYNARVKLVTWNMAEYKSELLKLAAINEMPDIFFTWEAGYLETLVENDRVLPIDELSSRQGPWYDIFEDGVFQHLTFHGKIYAVPMQQTIVVVFYNKDVFSGANLDIPETWDQFLLACETVKASGVTPMFIHGSSSWPAGQLFATLLAGCGGGELYQSLVDKKGWADDRIKTGAEALAMLYKKNFINYDTFLHSTAMDANKALKEGKAAMIINGDWATAGLRSHENIGAFLLPAIDPEFSGAAIQSVDQCYAMSNNCQNNEAALAFIKLLTGERRQIELMDKTGQLPAIKTASTVSNYPLQNDIYELYSHTKPGFLWIDRGMGTEIGSTFNSAAQAILSGEDVDGQLKLLRTLAD